MFWEAENHNHTQFLCLEIWNIIIAHKLITANDWHKQMSFDSDVWCRLDSRLWAATFYEFLFAISFGSSIFKIICVLLISSSP